MGAFVRITKHWAYSRSAQIVQDPTGCQKIYNSLRFGVFAEHTVGSGILPSHHADDHRSSAHAAQLPRGRCAASVGVTTSRAAKCPPGQLGCFNMTLGPYRRNPNNAPLLRLSIVAAGRLAALAKPAEPVLNDTYRRPRLFRRLRKQETLSIRRHVVPEASGPEPVFILKERCCATDGDGRSKCDLDGNDRIPIRLRVEEFLAVRAPSRSDAAVGGNRRLSATLRKALQVHFGSARLIRAVRPGICRLGKGPPRSRREG